MGGDHQDHQDDLVEQNQSILHGVFGGRIFGHPKDVIGMFHPAPCMCPRTAWMFVMHVSKQNTLICQQKLVLIARGMRSCSSFHTQQGEGRAAREIHCDQAHFGVHPASFPRGSSFIRMAHRPGQYVRRKGLMICKYLLGINNCINNL